MCDQGRWEAGEAGWRIGPKRPARFALSTACKAYTKLPLGADGAAHSVFHVTVRTVDELWLSVMLYPRRILVPAYRPPSVALAVSRAVGSTCQTAPRARRVRP